MRRAAAQGLHLGRSRLQGFGFYRNGSRESAKVGASGSSEESSDAKTSGSTSSSGALSTSSDTAAKPTSSATKGKKDKAPAAASAT